MPLRFKGRDVLAAPIPLTSLSDDIAALERALERTKGPAVLAAHAYAGAAIAAVSNGRVRSLVFIAALAPGEGETVAQIRSEKADHTPLAAAPESVMGLILEAVASTAV